MDVYADACMHARMRVCSYASMNVRMCQSIMGICSCLYACTNLGMCATICTFSTCIFMVN